jgi:hypothetical protein
MRATPAPIPELLPVTSALFPWSFKSIYHLVDRQLKFDLPPTRLL